MNDTPRAGGQNDASLEAAFTTVIKAFESKLPGSERTDLHTVISQAIDSIHAARHAIDRMEKLPVPPAGAPKPGSKQELEEELAKEKMDP